MKKTPILTLSLISAGVVAANRFVGYDRLQVAVAGKVAMGVADYGAASAGKPLAIDVLGTTRVETGGVFDEGDLIQADASGRAIEKAAGATLARALQPSTGEGRVVEVLLLPSTAAIA